MSKIETILVVDDADELRFLFGELLSKSGFNTLEASSGNAAIDIYKENKIDLILSDVRMPDGDGIHLLDELNKLDTPLPYFVLMTGYADFTEEEVKQKGVSKLLSKPVSIGDLLELITSLNG